MLELLAQQLIDGTITLEMWQAGMRDFIRVLHREAAIIAVGGAENMTPALWGYEGYLVKQQYAFLDGFAADIAANPEAWLNGRLLARMQLYGRAEWGTFEEIVKRKKISEGYTEERRVLGRADGADRGRRQERVRCRQGK